MSSVRHDRVRDEILITDNNGSTVRFSPEAWVNIETAVTLLLVDRARIPRPPLVACSDFADERTPVQTPSARTRVGRKTPT
jgi:hypothetical protein